MTLWCNPPSRHQKKVIRYCGLKEDLPAKDRNIKDGCSTTLHTIGSFGAGREFFRGNLQLPSGSWPGWTHMPKFALKMTVFVRSVIWKMCFFWENKHQAMFGKGFQLLEIEIKLAYVHFIICYMPKWIKVALMLLLPYIRIRRSMSLVSIFLQGSTQPMSRFSPPQRPNPKIPKFHSRIFLQDSNWRVGVWELFLCLGFFSQIFIWGILQFQPSDTQILQPPPPP